jgi:hypothetical protein
MDLILDKHFTIAELLKDVPRGYKIKSKLFYNTAVDSVSKDKIVIRPEKDELPLVVLDAEGKLPGSGSAICILEPDESSFNGWHDYRYFRFDYGNFIIDPVTNERHCIIKREWERCKDRDDDYYETVCIKDGFSYRTYGKLLRKNQMRYEVPEKHFYEIGDYVCFSENYQTLYERVAELTEEGYVFDSGRKMKRSNSFAWHTPFNISNYSIKQGNMFAVRRLATKETYLMIYNSCKTNFWGPNELTSQFTVDLDGNPVDEYSFSESDGFRPATSEEKELIKKALKEQHKALNEHGIVDYSGSVKFVQNIYGNKADIIIRGVEKDKIDDIIKNVKEIL